MEKVKSKVGKHHKAPHRQLPSQRVEIKANIEESPLANFIWRAQPPMCGRVNLKVQMIHEMLGKTSQSFQLDFKFISSHMDDHSAQMEAEKHRLIYKYVQEMFGLVSENIGCCLFFSSPFQELLGKF